MNLCGTFFSSSVMFWCKPGLTGRYLIRIKPPSNDLIHVCIFLWSPSSLKSLTMMSWIKNLSYSFAEASPSFAPNIIIAMVVRPWVPTYYNCNGCTAMGSQQGGCMAMDFKYYNCHTIAMARVPRSDSRPSQPSFTTLLVWARAPFVIQRLRQRLPISAIVITFRFS